MRSIRFSPFPWIALFFCLAGPSGAYVEVDATVDTAAVYVGDVITYRIGVTYDDRTVVEKLPPGINLTAFYLRNYVPINKERVSADRWHEGATYSISAYRPGIYVIPPVPVRYRASTGGTGELVTQPLVVEIKSLGVTESDTLRGIKDVKSIPPHVPMWFWFVAGAIPPALVLAYFLIRRRPTASEPRGANAVAGVVDEIAELEAIPAEELIRAGEIKILYTLVSDALRRYIARRYGINALELTLAELASLLGCSCVPQSQSDVLLSFLARCDLVKFARFVPPEDEFNVLIPDAKNLVRCTQATPPLEVETPVISSSGEGGGTVDEVQR